ncbi:MAG: hypothetical protein L6R38_005380 [Xanthoria sp. 2 TBL-2021]|nr:MAG: hypothetical protein L6R38_005380 [Xanthoria sp. 2 TBL-2021]
MNHDPVADPKLYEANGQPSDAVHDPILQHVDTTASTTTVPSAKIPVVESNKAAAESDGTNAVDRSDSEAETVVLDGKQEASHASTRKPIKNEDKTGSDAPHHPRTNGFHSVSDNDRRNGNGTDRPSLKRKRTSQAKIVQDNPPSSNLSSTVSSPGARAHSSQRSDSLSDRSRSSPAMDEGVKQQHIPSRMRKLARVTEDQDRNKRGKSDPNSVAANRKERRGTRNASHHEIGRHRSESPPRRRKRALSTQSADLSEKHKRKKIPPPLVVDRQHKTSEDTHGDSDDSSSIHSHRHLQKVASADLSVMSPAKLSYKKNRDRNGRTLLARACAMDINEAKKWLKERPQDIDIPDNAGNTPLQIASLEGLADVVQLLLDAGCDTNCKNIDMETPLIDAVENGHLEVVQLLLNAGLDPRQSNAKGEEPLDLVNTDNDDYDEIRAALVAAKESNTPRRPSEDHSVHNRDNDQSSHGASAASPTDGHTGRSPPPMGLGARRRTARSQQTQDSLLWVNPTPAKLREACGKGDLSVVDYILKMRPEVGTDAVIAAARGGHDVVLEILFAIGQLEHDPDPVESSDFAPGRNTPMLASIGRGHIPVIKLLVSQRGFNPTRRIFKGLTYHELAKERQGSNWEAEYAILKEAYDDFKINGGRRSIHGSPRKVRTKKPEGRRSTSDLPTSPLSSNKRQLSLASVRTAPEPEIKREHSLKTPSNKHLKIPEEVKDSAILSDRDSDANGRPEPKPKAARSVSDAGVLSSKSDTTKPRRKLLSRNDLKSNQDIKRRASHGPNTTTHEQQRRQSGDFETSGAGKKKREASETPIPIPKVRKDLSKDVHSSRGEPGKKRPRHSTSPQLRGAGDEEATVAAEKKKKRRVDSNGNAVMQDPQRSDTFVRTGPAMVANMIASPEPVQSPSEPPSKAPVANMGVSSASPITKSPTEVITQSEVPSPMSGIETTLQKIAQHDVVQEQVRDGTPVLSRPDHGSQRQAKPDKAAEDRRAAELERQKQAQLAREEEQRIAREQEEARVERQRQMDQAEQQARREQEEEEIRAATKRREEEVAKRRAEQERLRQEEQEWRNAELEEREQRRRIRLQELEQQRQREALPNSLRRAAESSPEKARQPQEIRKWLPLYTVTTGELDPGCDENVADERWIANVQAAPILAIRDLDLSQYTAWERKEVSRPQRQSLWRQVRNQMSQADINPLTFTWHDALRLDQETYPKFQDLKSLFWIKLSEFMDIVPRHPHLVGVKLRTRAMVLHDDPWGKGGENGVTSTNGGLVNGFR